jgi:short-subunit dehydrogenase
MASPIDGGVVLVTGASSGIGMAIARIVASRARAVVLVARRVDRLTALKEELLAARADVKIEIVGCDLSQRAEVERLPGELASRGLADVDVLVNNAGVGLMGAFDRADVAKTVAMIDLNVTAPTMLTAAVLPGMVARGRGAILNVSSGFGLGVLPSFAAYIGTKHFTTGFSEALLADLAGTGVTVTQVCPGPVATEFEQQIGNFTGQKAPGMLEISAERCARSAVRALDRRRAMVIPGFWMKVVMLVNGLSPRFLRRVFAGIVGRIARKKELEVASAARERGEGAIKNVPPDSHP